VRVTTFTNTNKTYLLGFKVGKQFTYKTRIKSEFLSILLTIILNKGGSFKLSNPKIYPACTIGIKDIWYITSAFLTLEK